LIHVKVRRADLGYESSEMEAIMLVETVLKSTGRKIATLAPEATTVDAAELLADPDINIVAVCDKNGRILGVVTDSDILRDFVRCRGTEQVCAPNVAAIMTRRVCSCRREDEAEQILATMKARGLRRIPVVDAEGQAVGLLTMRDVLLKLYEQAKLEDGALRDYMFGVGWH
jgi:CBS domain-containing protein